MPKAREEPAHREELRLATGGPAATAALGEEGGPAQEIAFRPPFSRPGFGTIRNILATIIVGIVIAGLVWYFDRPGGAGGSESVTLTASPSGPAPRVGEEAPDFRVQGLDGQHLQLGDFRGRPVWISFWATWCPPCRAENPDIEEVYQKKREEGLVILALSIGEDAGTVKDYVERTGLTYTIGLDQGTEVAATYRIVGIPTHYFVDRDGILRDWRVGSMSKKTMEEKVEEILSVTEGGDGE